MLEWTLILHRNIWSLIHSSISFFHGTLQTSVTFHKLIYSRTTLLGKEG